MAPRLVVSKSQPTITDVHVNGPLTNISVGFLQSSDAFVASRVFPRISVGKMSDFYYVYNREDFYRSDAQKRAPGTMAARKGHRLSQDTYTADRWAVAEDIPDPVRANYDNPLDPDMDGTNVVSLDLMIRQDVDWAARYFTTGVWTGSSSGTDITPASVWNDAASDPVGDIKNQARAIEGQTGYMPNTLVLGRKVFDDLSQNPDIIDRIKYTAGAANPAIVTEQVLAALFGVSRVFVPRGVRNSGAEGGTASFAYIAGARHALLCYSAPAPGLRVPSAGYTFSWTAPAGAGNEFGIRIKRYRNPEALESDSIEGEMWYDQKVVAAVLGAFFNNAVAA